MHIARRSWVATLFVTISLVVAVSGARAAEVDDILGRMRSALEPGKDMRANVVFTITNERGETVKWTGHLYRRGGSATRLRLTFDDPADLRGTDVTVTRTSDGAGETRIYLPALRRVRSIDAQTRGESFLGTDFNYEDLGLQRFDDQQHRLVASQNASCYRIESTPNASWWYGRVVRCIDKKTYLPTRTEYYDRSGVLWKVRTLGGVKKIGTYPTATEIKMETVPQHTSTTITLSDVQYDTGLADSLFTAP